MKRFIVQYLNNKENKWQFHDSFKNRNEAEESRSRLAQYVETVRVFDKAVKNHRKDISKPSLFFGEGTMALAMENTFKNK